MKSSKLDRSIASCLPFKPSFSRLNSGLRCVELWRRQRRQLFTRRSNCSIAQTRAISTPTKCERCFCKRSVELLFYQLIRLRYLENINLVFLVRCSGFFNSFVWFGMLRGMSDSCVNLVPGAYMEWIIRLVTLCLNSSHGCSSGFMYLIIICQNSGTSGVHSKENLEVSHLWLGLRVVSGYLTRTQHQHGVCSSDKTRILSCYLLPRLHPSM